jgi:hypothetical protein
MSVDDIELRGMGPYSFKQGCLCRHWIGSRLAEPKRARPYRMKARARY